MTEAIEPSGYLKQILAHDEKVTMIVRQHWLVLWGRMFSSLFLSATLIVAVVAVRLYVAPDRPEVLYGFAAALIPLAFAFW